MERENTTKRIGKGKETAKAEWQRQTDRQTQGQSEGKEEERQ